MLLCYYPVLTSLSGENRALAKRSQFLGSDGQPQREAIGRWTDPWLWLWIYSFMSGAKTAQPSVHLRDLRCLISVECLSRPELNFDEVTRRSLICLDP